MTRACLRSRDGPRSRSCASAQVAVRGETVYTMAGAPAEGRRRAREGRQDRRPSGPRPPSRFPPATATLAAKVVTPGLVDARSDGRPRGLLNQPHDQDQLETSAAIQPELRAIDAYNPTDRLVGWVRGFGVTTIHTGHGPGALISGQTMIVKTRGQRRGRRR